MKQILCFGDSNTWGFIPAAGKRYPESIRWTGILQKELGNEYHVIEDGMNARTTAFPDPTNPYLNGRDTLPAALIAQKPLDLLVIMLGTNDLKFVGAKASARAAGGLIELVKSIQSWDEVTKPFPDGVKILLVSPIHLHAKIDKDFFSVFYGRYRDSLEFSTYYKHTAEVQGVFFFDASLVAEPSETDCVHMEPAEHEKLGKALAHKIKEIINT